MDDKYDKYDNDNDNNLYKCDCGCELYFIKYTVGLQLYLKKDNIHNIIINENKINENKINNYDFDLYKNAIINLTCNEFILLITQKKNEDSVWFHLYNEYIDLINYNIPNDSTIKENY